MVFLPAVKVLKENPAEEREGKKQSLTLPVRLPYWLFLTLIYPSDTSVFARRVSKAPRRAS